MTHTFTSNKGTLCFHHEGDDHCACNTQIELFLNRYWSLKKRFRTINTLAKTLIKSLEHHEIGPLLSEKFEDEWPLSSAKLDVAADKRNLKGELVNE